MRPGLRPFITVRDFTVSSADGGAEPQHPLKPYFDSGTIQIYLDSDGATLDGGGAVTAITNAGAAGVAFDATVSGAAVALSGNALVLSATSGTPILATPTSLDGVRMMWAFTTGGLRNTMRLMGSATDEIRIASIQSGPPRTVFSTLWSNRDGAGAAVNMTPRWTINETGMHVHELETNLTADTATLWQDGVQVSTSAAITHSGFTVDRIGQGTGTAIPYDGLFGGVCGVVTGLPDTAAAIAAVRSLWAARFSVVMA